MKFVGRWLGICVMVLSGVSANAADPEMGFLKVLRDNGYGDVAVDYLKVLQKRPDSSAEIRDIWDLEMARSLRAAATNAYNAADADQLSVEAQKYLDKFIKDKPSHPLAFEALADSATFAKARGLNLLRSAEQAAEPEKKEKFRTDAREILEAAKPKFGEARSKFVEALQKLPKPPKKSQEKLSKKERDAADAYYDCLRNMAAARYEEALLGYYIAQTYADPSDATRKSILKETSDALDKFYQEYRYVEDSRGDIAMFAHMWQGKVVEELGDPDTALDIYEEVLVRQDDEAFADLKTQALLTLVERFKLGIIAKRKPDEYVEQAKTWLNDYNAKLRSTDGYGVIALDLVEFLLAAAEKDNDKKVLADAKAVCQEMAKTPGPHQGVFRKMMREKFAGAVGKPSGEPKNFAEAVSFGDSSAVEGNFEDAERYYAKAQELGEKATRKPKKEELDKLQESRATAMYGHACSLFRKDPAECLKLATRIMNEFDGTQAAPTAGALRVQVQLFIYGSIDAKDPKQKEARAAALATLEKLADETIKKWPGKPEADDARIALGQASLVRDDLDKAIKTFDTCNPKSDRYGVAMQYAGQSLWRRCLLERQKAESDQNKEQMKSDAEEAAKRLEKSVKLQKLQLEKKKAEEAKALQKTLADMQLMLAEVYSFSNEPAKAAEVLQPLVDTVKDIKKDEEIPPATLRIATGAVRAFLASNQLDKATEIGLVLNEVGPDEPAINNVLVEFAKQLNHARKQAEADKISATGDAAKTAADAKLASVQGAMKKLLPKLAERKQLGLNTMVMLGDFLAAADLNELASAQYDKILAAHGSSKDKDVAKSMTRVRVQLVGLLKKKGDYERAAKQMEKLIEGQPNALDALMERGRILQAWAEKDPTKWVEAATKWNQLMERLKNVKGKDSTKKPPEFYEVTYNLAFCLANDAARATDKKVAQEKFKAAQQVLGSTLFNEPKLNDSPDMVAKYKALTEKLKKALTKDTEPAKPK